MNNSDKRLRKVLRIALIACAALPSSGCLLYGSVPAGETGYEVECFVTVVNPDGQEVVIASRTHPDFLLESEAGEVGLQQFFLAGERYTCPAGESPPAWGSSIEEIEDKWGQWVGQRIGEIIDRAPSDSDFNLFGGPWCQKPDSLRCELRGAEVRNDPEDSGACDAPAIDGPALEDCPAPRPVACLEVSCGGRAPCDAIAFKDPEIPVGDVKEENVVLRNCGFPNDPVVKVTVDWSAFATGLQGDFAVINNDCLPDPGDPDEEDAGVDVLAPQQACAFDVEFRPSNPGVHEANVIFGSSVEAQHVIALSGKAQAGALRFGLLDPAEENPAQLCFDTLQGACTGERRVLVLNDGPGAVRIDDVRLEPEGTGFVLSSLDPELPLPVPQGGAPLPADDTARVRIQWCGNGAAADEATLFIESNGAPPAYELPLLFDPDGCPR